MNIVKVGRKDFFENEKKFNLTWFVTKRCNYKCPYCGIKNNEPFVEEKNWRRIVNYINSLEKSGKNVIVNITGGESLLHPDIIEIVNSLEVTQTRIKTNSSPGLDVINNFLLGTKPEIHIQAEYHYPYIWPEEYLEKIEFIVSRIHFVFAKLVWDIRNKEFTFEAYKKSKELENKYSNLKVYLDIPQHPFFLWEKEDYEFVDSLKQDKDFIVEYEENNLVKTLELSYSEAVRICKENLLSFSNFKCSALDKSVLIDSNGDVFKCNQYFYDKNTGFEEVCSFEKFCYEIAIPKIKD